MTLTFAAFALGTVVWGLWLRAQNAADRTNAGKHVVAPLEMSLKFECAPPKGDPVPFKSGDTCPAGGTLRITVERLDAEIAQLGYAWVTPTADTLGAIVKTPGLTTGLQLGTEPGERFLILIPAQKTFENVPLSQALTPLPPASVPRHRAGALRGHAATLVRNGIHARSEILKVIVEAK